ncbi:MAG: class I SAM-dependent methyltransferase [Acidobacteria bacterium]|nr:class I SAM-dependent methyltransferase [Acidobacteriota bacterium]
MNPRLYVDADFNPTLHARLIRLSYPFTRMSNIRTRWEFPHVLNALGLKNEGVEVGVLRGNFSDYILRTWKGRKLYSVDPFRSFPDSGYVDINHFDDPTYEEMFQVTSKRLSKYGGRSEMVRQASPSAASHFTDGQLDFVYIDAQHHYEAVRDDLAAWWPKIKRGGILGGHDYLDAVNGAGVFGVKTAVTEFTAKLGFAPVISQEAEWRSYFIRKP